MLQRRRCLSRAARSSPADKGTEGMERHGDSFGGRINEKKLTKSN